MHKKPVILPAISLALGVMILIHGAEPGLAQKPKPKKQDPGELEKKLLTIPAEPLDRDWQKTWQEHLLISFLNDEQYSRLAIGITNRTPCTIRVLSTNVVKLVKDGRGRIGPPWDVPAGKKLYAGVRAGLPMATIENNLSGSTIGALELPTNALCEIEVLPNDPKTKPFALVVVYVYGTDLNGRFVAGDYYLCRPEQREQVQKEVSRRR